MLPALSITTPPCVGPRADCPVGPKPPAGHRVEGHQPAAHPHRLDLIGGTGRERKGEGQGGGEAHGKHFHDGQSWFDGHTKREA